MNQITLSDEQSIAVAKINDWFTEAKQPIFKLGGYAGTGKTTVIRFIRDSIQGQRKSVIVSAFTGKAVNVLERKQINAQTLHSLLYDVEPQPGGGVSFNRKHRLDQKPDLIIVDEASMVSTELNDTLLSHNIPVLFVGDPGQLEPVGDNPELMRSPDYVLEKIHRQAESSPIITLANSVRQGGAILKGDTGSLSVRGKYGFRIPEAAEYDQVICARNATRRELNNKFRLFQGRPKNELLEGDKIIVLRNNQDYMVFNGVILYVTSILKSTDAAWFINAKDEADKQYQNLPIWKFPFNNEMPKEFTIPRVTTGRNSPQMIWADFGYCITCHKSQGSEWDKVLLWHEWMPPKIWDMKRWSYTGITRAAKELTICL